MVDAVEISYRSKNWQTTLNRIRQLPTAGLTARLWFIRGHAYDELQQNTAAIGAYTTAIGLDSTMAYAYYNRGNVYVDLKQAGLARTDYICAKSLFTAKKDKDDCDQQLKKLAGQ